MIEKYYTGVGSRNSPKNVLNEMVDIGYSLAMRGWTLRSGGAKGADHAFESGAMQTMNIPEIFLPWKKFNGHLSPLYSPPPEAYELALRYHPNPKYLRSNKKVFDLMARNTQQVLGRYITEPSDFLLCWTSDGVEDGKETTKETGGTGQAIRIASAYKIPVFNLKNFDSVARLMKFLKIKEIIL